MAKSSLRTSKTLARTERTDRRHFTGYLQVEYAAVFHVQMNNTFTLDRNYRVYVTDSKLLFARIGGQNFHQLMLFHFGLVGGLLYSWSQKNEAKKKEQLIRELDELPADELVDAHKHNFRLGNDDVETCTIDAGSAWAGHGPCVGLWKLELFDSRKMKFQFSTVDDMKTAIKFLPTICRESFASNVEWNESKQQYRKKSS